MHWEWKSMAVNFALGQAINLKNRVFAYWASKYPEMHAHSIIHPCVFSSSCSWSLLGIFPS